MKKVFELTHPKIKRPRMIESIKSDVKKYIKREQRKNLPEKVDFWDFDCRYGKTADEAKKIHVKEINSFIDTAEKSDQDSFYLEILAKPGIRTKKPKETAETND